MTRSFIRAGVLVGCVLLTGFGTSAQAQEPDPPRTAFVLSGGGSRGLAHAGALLGLEQLGYDADLVVGTSMGALMGALYAAGYPPEEIQRRIVAMDWGEIFSAAPFTLGPDRIVRYPLVVIDRDADPLRFNRGFIPQWRANRAIVHLLFDANARARGDFDNLARRFRAVAADLRTGDLVVLAEGDLARAVRASIAVPGILAPVEWDGTFLVDGGIADNLPVGTARALGADQIVAVDVRSLYEEILDRRPWLVVNRALDIILRNARPDTLPADVTIVPRLPPYLTTFSFPSDPTPFFELGLHAALRDAPEVGKGPPDQPALPSAPASFGTLEIEAPDPAFEMLAANLFSTIAPGPYDPEAVLSAVDRLYTTGLVEAVWPRVEDAGPGADPTLVVRVEAPPALSFAAAAGYDGDRGGRLWASAQQSTIVLGAPSIGAISGYLTTLEQWGALSARVLLPALPILGWTGGIHLKETDVRLFDSDRVGGIDVVRAGGWLGLEFQQALSARTAIGTLRGEWIDVEDGVKGFSFGPLVRLAVPAAKSPIVGVQPFIEAEVRWGEIGYSRAQATGSYEIRFGDLRTAGIADFAIASAGAPADIYPALGDARAIPGYRWGEVRDRVRAIGGVDLAHPIFYRGYARARLRAGAAVPELNGLRDAPWIAGAEIGALWRTPLGTLMIGWGINTADRQNLIIDIGSVF